MSHDKKDDPRRPKLIELLSQGMTFAEAAETIGVSSRTLFRWCEDDPSLAEMADEARCKIDDEVEAVTLKNCLNADPSHNSLRMFWLKSRRPGVYREVQQQDHKGGITIRVEYTDANGANLIDAHDPIAAPASRAE